MKTTEISGGGGRMAQRCEHLRDGEPGVLRNLPGYVVAEVCGDCDRELRQRLETRRREETPIEAYARQKEIEMTGCAYDVGKKTTTLCGILVQTGSVYCPRHTYLYNLAEQEKAQKLAKAQNIADIGVKLGKLPPTRASLMKQFYHFVNDGVCNGCGAPIEWWRTPAGKRAPFEPMDADASFAKSHFATCKNAIGFRKAS